MIFNTRKNRVRLSSHVAFRYTECNGTYSKVQESGKHSFIEMYCCFFFFLWLYEHVKGHSESHMVIIHKREAALRTDRPFSSCRCVSKEEVCGILGSPCRRCRRTNLVTSGTQGLFCQHPGEVSLVLCW